MIISNAKKELRRELKRRFDVLPPEFFVSEGRAASLRLAKTKLWKHFDRILIYLSMPDELDTSELLKIAFYEKKQVFAPKVESNTLMRFFRVTEDSSKWVQGAFGIREPIGDKNDLFRPEDGMSLVISPGLAFDQTGNRLGRGRGYYDRFYEKLFLISPDSKICAFCTSVSLLVSIPVDSFDMKVDAICTKDFFLNINCGDMLE